MVDPKGTYICFYGRHKSSVVTADIKHFNLLKTWTLKKDDDFALVNNHEKRAARQDSRLEAALRQRIESDLQSAKHLLLIIERRHPEETEVYHDDWVSLEIGYAIDECHLPVVAAYTNYEYVLAPQFLSNLWPAALKRRIENGTARIMHIPFKKIPIKTALNQFYPSNPPSGSLAYYSEKTYKKWGLIK